jgi:hypothetical protein
MRQADIDFYNSVFLNYSVQNDLALCVVHRHFSLEPSEQLVEYQHVTAPWRVGESLDYFQPRISPKNWTFIDGRLFPYEFRFADSDDAAEPYSFPPAFVDDLLEVFTRHNLQDVYGLAKLQVEDRDMTTPGLLEFTAGRTNIAMPFMPVWKSLGELRRRGYFPAPGPSWSRRMGVGV